jgi:hypothetical protein
VRPAGLETTVTPDRPLAVTDNVAGAPVAGAAPDEMVSVALTVPASDAEIVAAAVVLTGDVVTLKLALV